MLDKHIKAIRELSEKNNVLLIDAVNHYQQRNDYDPYFIAEIVQSDKAFFSQLKKEAKNLKLVK